MRLRTVVLVALMALTGCAAAGPPSTVPDGPEPVRLVDEPATRREEASAARLYLQAREAWDAGDLEQAAAAAHTIVESYPGSAVSADALWLRTRAFARMESRGLQALDDAERLLGVLPAADSRVGTVAFLYAGLLRDRGAAAEGLLVLLRVERATVPTEWSAFARETIEGVELDAAAELASTVAEDPSLQRNPLAGELVVGLGRLLRLGGRATDATAAGQAAIGLGVSGEVRETATLLAEGRPLPEELERTVILAAILPKSGSPSMRRIADRIEAGIEAAIEAIDGVGQVELRVLDDGGDPEAARSLVMAAERQGAIAVLGPLAESGVAAAAEARRQGTILLSPTAIELPSVARGVFSLSAFDPTASERLAEWIGGAPVGGIAVIHADRGPSAEEARAFEAALTAAGGQLLGRIPYPVGQTFFEDQIEAALALEPGSILLPIPVEDVPALAPQATFFGLDTLGVRVFGTGAWTRPETLQDVSTRHLDGVVAASPDHTGEGPGWDRFQAAYEARFQRSLIDGTVEALGYDAAALLLSAIAAGGRTPASLGSTLERIPPFAGATGDLQIREGRVRRAHTVVCLHDAALLPTTPGDLPVLQYRPYPPDPETDSIPEGPGRMAGYLCPQVAPADSVN